MKVIIHIGQSKTGTSALQSFLTKQRAELIKYGISYPSPVVHGIEVDLGSHNVVADALAGKIRYPFFSDTEYFNQFFRHARRNNCHTMILSAEHFFAGEPRFWKCHDIDECQKKYLEKVRRLKHFLKGCEVELVIFLRPQVDWFASNRAQNITHGRLAGRGPEINDDWAEFKRKLPRLKHSSRLRVWKEIICPSRFIVIPYVRDQMVDGNSISEFFNRLGLEFPIQENQFKVEANVTLTSEYIEVKKRLNLQVRSKAEERAVITCLRSLSRASKHSASYRLPARLTDELINAVQEDNNIVSKEFMDGQALPAEGSYFDKEKPPLTEEEIDTAERSFWNEFRKPRYRWLRMRNSFLSFARKRLRLLHVLLLKSKRLKRWFRNFRSIK